jgi:poly(3-hydroxybutyrate) depolymerase
VRADGSEAGAGQPKLLIVAPMSGHYATLLRGTVQRMLPVADVYITDWRDAKLVPTAAGRFDLDDYVDYLIAYLEHIGAEGDPRPNVLAVCQPSVPCYAAVALMSADSHPNRPRTLTMMGGPIDTREAPTAVNTLATERPHAWFEQNVIATVPMTYPGAGRKVYPGFLQLAGFMTMNLGSHMISHWELFKHLVQGDGESADATMRFYDEYRSVCDMTAEFYLQTIDTVFQSHALPKGEMTHRGRRVDPSAITDVALLAIEGEKDDISGLGQTKAALTIADRLPDAMKHYHMAPAVGHYGIFNGSKWRNQIAPVLEDWMVQHAG